MKKKVLSLVICMALMISMLPQVAFFASAASSGTCGDNLTWTLDDEGTLTISGTGSMDFMGSPPWSGTDVKTVVIEDGVTSIGYGAFEYCTSLTSATIPDSVTVIGGYAFYRCTSLRSVTMGKGVKSIGDSAFYDCTSLTDLIIPESVTSIGDSAFRGCISLPSVTIPDSVTSIGEYAFYDCSSLTSVIIPDSVTSIGEYAFYGCTSLTSVTILDGVTSIGDHAFDGCTSLTSVTVPDSVTKIGSYAFGRNSKVTIYCFAGSAAHIYAKKNSDYIKKYELLEVKQGRCGDNLTWSLDDAGTTLTISGTGAMNNYAGDTFPWYLSKATIKKVVIEDGVTSIGDYAFDGCINLTSVTIPDSVTSIGNYAFRGCTSLPSVTIPDGVTNIENYAFYGCTGLENLTIGKGVTSIGDYAFKNCPGLTSVIIPDSVTSIGSSAFYDCTGLTSVIIPDSVTSIGSSAFYDCTGLTSITIGKGVTSIGDYAFKNCPGLTSITIPDSVTSIGSSAFSNCTGLTSITIPDSVTSIGISAFNGCTGLTSITIPDSVTSIGSSAFYDCTGLTSITIGKGVTSIGSYAFVNCTGLTSITIPDSVTSIGTHAFYKCTGLTSITIPDSVTSIGSYAFVNCSSLKDVYYIGTAESWASINIKGNNDYLKNATRHYVKPTGIKLNKTEVTLGIEESATITAVVEPGTAIYNSILWTSSDESVAIVENGVVSAKKEGSVVITARPDTGDCEATCIVNVVRKGSENSLNWVLDKDGVLTISGRGRVENLWEDYIEKIKEIVIEDGIDEIYYEAFYEYTELEKVTLPETLTTIYDSAFEACAKLKEIHMPKSIEEIGGYAFYDCAALSDVYYADCLENWEKVTIGEDNDSLTGADFHFAITLAKGVTLDKEQVELYVGEKSTLTQTVTPEETTNKAVTWATSDAGVATVSNGVVTANGAGIATITVTTKDGGYTDTCTICVNHGKGEYENLTWNLDAYGHLTISGTGEIAEGTMPWSTYSTYVKKLTVNSGITAIGASAFAGYTNLEEANLAHSILTINEAAFSGCSKLKAIEIPKEITNIPATTFENCTALASVTMYNKVKTVRAAAFNGCTALTDVYFYGTEEDWDAISIRSSNNALKNATVIYETPAEPITYKFGQSAQIGLIEPWFLKANAVAYIEDANTPIDYASLKDYGAYFVRKSDLVKQTVTQETLTTQEIIDNANVVKCSKADGTAKIDGRFITASYNKGIYTYELDDSVFVMFYVENDFGIQYAPIRERNIKDLVEARKNDSVNFTNVLERNVYAGMDALKNTVDVYRAQFSEIKQLPAQDAPTLAEFTAENGVFTAETSVDYTFSNSVQIVLVEPWGLKFNAKVSKKGESTKIDYSSIEEYGAIVFYDTQGEMENGMTKDDLMTKENAYVFSSKNNDAYEDGQFISALYNKGIYTYQLDSNAYVMFYVKDANGYHYGEVKTRNAYDLATARAQDTVNFPKTEERAVYASMMDMYDAVTKYRENYFKNN